MHIMGLSKSLSKRRTEYPIRVSHVCPTIEQQSSPQSRLILPKNTHSYSPPKGRSKLAVTAGVFADYQIRVIHHGGLGGWTKLDLLLVLCIYVYCMIISNGYEVCTPIY